MYEENPKYVEETEEVHYEESCEEEEEFCENEEFDIPEKKFADNN